MMKRLYVGAVTVLFFMQGALFSIDALSGNKSGQDLANNNYLWWEAEDYTSGDFPKSGVFDPQTPEQAKKLSAGRWINTGEKSHPLYKASYTLNLSKINNKNNTYYFYTRKFWYHGPFRYRFNQGPWHNVNKVNHPRFKDSVSIKQHVVVNWVELGHYQLNDKHNILELQLTSHQGAAAFDSFVLSAEPFIPLGLRKPHQQLNRANKGYWSFEPKVDFFTDNALWDLRSLNENIAGEQGYIALSKDSNSFVLANGDSVRFWSINTSIQRSRNIKEIDRHARHLAKRGVNMVRFHGFIESKTDNLFAADQDQIEHSWRLVASMKKQGIYTTLSPYWATHAKPRKAWGVTQGNDKNLTGLLFFDPVLQKAYKAWLRQWLTTPNPYTGISLAKDPAVAIIQIQNEDSLLFWTFNAIQGEQRRLLEQQFTAWLNKKYGSLKQVKKLWGSFSHQRDDVANGYIGLSNIRALTKVNQGRQSIRDNDQYQFLVETMRQWHQEVEDFLRKDIGYQGLINAGNWRTADNVTMLDGERWSYGVNQVMAVNKYYTGGVHINPTTQHHAGYLIKKGDYYQNQSALLHPRKLPFNVKQVNAYPMIISESTWVSPMDYQSEAPFLVAAYSSLNGIDSYYWFNTDAEGFASGVTKFGAASPSIMATYPAAAFMFRKGYIQQAEPVIAEHRSMDNIWQREPPTVSEEPGFDPNRDKGLLQFLLPSSNDVDPMAFLVGPVVSHYNSEPSKTSVKPLESFIDRDRQRIYSSTQELMLDYKHGISTINANKVQGVTGFLDKVSPVILQDMRIISDSHYATVLAVALDNQPLNKSHKLLLQITTRVQPYNFSAKPVTFSNPHNKKDRQRYQGYQIDNMGTIPLNMEEHNIEVILNNQHINEAIMTDMNGYSVRKIPLIPTGKGIHLHIPPQAVYIVLQKQG